MKWFALAVLLLGITSCSYKDEWKTINNLEWKIALEVPDYLESDHSFSPTAGIQGGNKYRNFYFLVDRPKAEATKEIQAFKKLRLSEFEAGVKSFEEVSSDKGEINGMPYESKVILANVGGVGAIQEDLLYHHYFVEGENAIYHLVIWHWEQWTENYEAVVPKIAASFKELP